MATVAYKQLALDTATLSGGAVLSAAGGGLPRRITTEAEALVVCRVQAGYSSVIADPDGLHIWSNNETGSTIKRWLISTGASDLTLTLASVMSISRIPGDTANFWGFGYVTLVCKKYRFSDGAVQVTGAMPAGITMGCIVSSATLGWGFALNGGVATEFTLATGVATGRTIAGTTQDMATDGTYIYVSTGASVKKYDLATLTLQATWTWYACYGNAPGDAYIAHVWGLSIDAAGNVYVQQALTGTYWLLNPAGGAYSAGVTRVYIQGAPEQTGGSAGGQNYNYTSTYGQFLTGICWSDDGNYVFMPAETSTLYTNFTTTKRVNIGLQRTRWGTPTTILSTTLATTMLGISITGNFGNSQDASNDFRRVKFYYSLNAGMTRVAFEPGQLLSVAVPANTAVTIDVDVTLNGMMPGPLPYISELNSYAAMILYSSAVTQTHKCLGRSKPDAGIATTIYTPDSGINTIVSSMIVANVSAVVDYFRIYIVPALGAVNINNALFYDVPVHPGDSFVANIVPVIEPQGFIAVSSTGGNLTFTLSGLDVP